MQAIWRLATNSLAGRPARTALLLAAVALATCLVIASGVCIDTVTASISQVVGRVTGRADLRISHMYNEPFDMALLDVVRAWPDVEHATATCDIGVTLKILRNNKAHIVKARGIDLDTWPTMNPLEFIEGHLPTGDGEVTLGKPTADKLGATVGDNAVVLSLGQEVPVKIVGIFDRQKLDVLQHRLIFVARSQAEAWSDQTGIAHEILVQLRDGADPQAVQAAHKTDLPEGVRFQTSAGAAAQVNRMLKGADLMMLILTIIIYLAAAFIILTSLGITVIERLGELAILRCIGASRTQIAIAQLLGGAMLSLIGAVIGVLPGIAAAYWFYSRHSDVLVAGFDIDPLSIVRALAAATGAGIVGASYPAVLAATRPPLQGLGARAATASRRALIVTTVVGLACAASAPLIHVLPFDAQTAFWIFITLGLPLTFVGFFLLTAPLALLVGHLIAPPLAIALRVPVDLLRRQFIATPYRNGFAGGALMVGMALLVTAWTVGPSLLQGWLTNIRMPDGFVHSFFAMSDRKWQALQGVDAVTDVCPVTAFPVTPANTSFGIEGISAPATLFISCDVDAFLRMVDLEWIEGDPDTAMRRSREGRTLIVSREYRVAHGIGLGDTLTLLTPRGPTDFEIVGVVASKGLDIATHTFGIQQSYAQAALSAVFGTRDDAEKLFGVRAINLVLLNFKPDVSDRQAVEQIRESVPGVIVGSSRRIVRNIRRSVDRMLAVISVLASAILAITCLGVTNLIAAMLAAQRFELGVLRAVGASRGMLARAVIAQALLLAVIGTVAGVGLGYTLASADHTFHARMLGIEYGLKLPTSIIGYGALAVAAGALLAAAPPLASLMRQRVREMIVAG